MDVNVDAGILTPRGVLRFFASNRTSTGCSCSEWVTSVSRQKPAVRTTRLHPKEDKTITTDPGGAFKAPSRFRTSEICRFSGAITHECIT
ncbi:hypothetical protein C1X61_07935 [Pseudomonas sp. FW215-T2]|nr:hypothetical protein C1X61_07935 [Pseudomonas sp. FW215-T2]PNA13177.1 hypothetical protein C1X62_10285 [Pseudomonas sp. FW215-R3]PNB38063.1 hypothetical protein C1X63_10280 [Pseudomonas sp. FW305-131]